MTRRPGRKLPPAGHGDLVPPLGVAEAQRRLGEILLLARAMAAGLRDLTATLDAPGPPAERRDRKAVRLRSYLRAMVGQMSADEVEPLLVPLERAARITAAEVPDEYPVE